MPFAQLGLEVMGTQRDEHAEKRDWGGVGPRASEVGLRGWSQLPNVGSGRRGRSPQGSSQRDLQ